MRLYNYAKSCYATLYYHHFNAIRIGASMKAHYIVMNYCVILNGRDIKLFDL